MLETRNLDKSFGAVHVTRDVSLKLERGERRVILGPNGAGKTTLFNQLVGELTPDSGSVHPRGRGCDRAARRQTCPPRACRAATRRTRCSTG